MKGELKKLALKDLRLREKGRKEGERWRKIPEMTLKDSRPAETNACEAPGHREGNLIIGKDHKSAILVMVERHSRFVQMDLLESMDAQTVCKRIEKRFKKLETELRKTITIDLGRENSEHKQLSEHTAMSVYFCHPHSLWEKGTSENTNYLIRDMLYPVDDFRELPQRDVTRIARLLNERPRKTPKCHILKCNRKTECLIEKKVSLGRRFSSGRKGLGGKGLPQREDSLGNIVL